MNCFPFSLGHKTESKSTKSILTQSSICTFTNNELTLSESELNSENGSNNSIETKGRSAPQSLSRLPSNLRAFTYSELKAATKNFSHSTKLGEGGFGCVYKGVIKGFEDPTQKLHVAIKQLSRRGSQVLINFFLSFLVVFLFVCTIQTSEVLRVLSSKLKKLRCLHRNLSLNH